MDRDKSQSQDFLPINSLNTQTNTANSETDNTTLYNLEDIKDIIEKQSQEIEKCGYVFQKQPIQLPEDYSILYNNLCGTDNVLLSYTDICNYYKDSDKLVDKYGRVFFYIPGISNALISNNELIKNQCYYLLPMYRKWLLNLVSYEITIEENNKINYVKNLGNRCFIYGDNEYIKNNNDKRFVENYKTTKDKQSFHVVFDKNQRVYYSDIPKEKNIPQLQCKLVVENLAFLEKINKSLKDSLFSNCLETTIINNDSFINNYNEKGSEYINKYNPRFLYNKTVGLPLCLHRINDFCDLYGNIVLNVEKYCIKPTLFFMDQEKFNSLCTEINLLSQQRDFCKDKQFSFKTIFVKQKQLQDLTPKRHKIWNISLSDSLYKQTDAIKDIFNVFRKRKLNYIQRISLDIKQLQKNIENYLNCVFYFLNTELKNNYLYFSKNTPQNNEETKKEKFIFNIVEQILQKTTLFDLESKTNICTDLIRENTGIFTIISQKYLLSEIIANNPKVNLLELLAYSFISYMVKIILYEFEDSVLNTEYELQQENNFIEKVMLDLNIPIEINLDNFETNDKYSLLYNDFEKLYFYTNTFCRSDIKTIRKYKYIIKRLLEIKDFYKKELIEKTLLNTEIENKINNIVNNYKEKIQQLTQEICKLELKHKTWNVPWKKSNTKPTIGEKILMKQSLNELDKFSNIEKNINIEEIFETLEKQRQKSYKQYLGYKSDKETLVIYNNGSFINKQKVSQEFCNQIDNYLMQPGYSYCYYRSLENFNRGDLQTKLDIAIVNNNNIHIVGVNDGTADAQYILGYISDILNAKHFAGKDYSGEIFVELYNPVGISQSLAEKIHESILKLLLKNKITVNIINNVLNKSLAVGSCLGIDYGVISDKSFFLIQNPYLKDLKSCIDYETPHYVQFCNEEYYYTKLLRTKWKIFKENILNIESGQIPTVHCIKRLLSLTNSSVNNTDIINELYNNILYDENLYKKLYTHKHDYHYCFNDIKDYLVYGNYLQNKINKLFEHLQKKEKFVNSVEQCNNI